jgi:hypothetical protein
MEQGPGGNGHIGVRGPGRPGGRRAGDEDRLHSSTDFPKIDTEASERDLVFLAKGLILGDVSKIFDEPLLERRDRLA